MYNYLVIKAIVLKESLQHHDLEQSKFKISDNFAFCPNSHLFVDHPVQAQVLSNVICAMVRVYNTLGGH